jgi:hypothetical protein
MATGGDQESGEEPRSGEEHPQDPLVERLRPDPSQPPQAVLTLAGLLGDSDRPGFRRLYFTRDLDYYAEFQTEDVLDIASIPAEQPPFLGHDATRVTLKRAATIEYTRVRSPRAIDEFDETAPQVRRAAPLSMSRGDGPEDFLPWFTPDEGWEWEPRPPPPRWTCYSFDDWSTFNPQTKSLWVYESCVDQNSGTKRIRPIRSRKVSQRELESWMADNS